MIFWKDRKEQLLFVFILILFLFLCFLESHLPLLNGLNGGFIEFVFASDGGLKTISSGLCISTIAAYIFYVFIDLLPRSRKEQRLKNTLNLVIASILDSYDKRKVYGHEVSISYSNTEVLKAEWLKSTLAELKHKHTPCDYLKLKFAMQTAYTRLTFFNHSLPLAVSLSPEKALQWLDLMDKVRLLAENYEETPNKTDSELLKTFEVTLRFRMLEYVECAIKFINNG